ncbi:hypothetical protein FRC09_008497 [Ceratobasidium sp. 395]|nr:hypothetical protein FRC09_008497 [Ceratobasidium sp. 395]
MAPWIVSAIFTNVSSIWERNSRSYEDIKAADAGVLLKEIDNVLGHTSKLLQAHRDLLSDREFAGFKAQHRTYLLVFTDEQQKLDKASNATEKAESQDRAARLLNTVKAYRGTVFEASQKATQTPAPAFPDEERIPTDLTAPLDTQVTTSADQAAPPALDIPTHLQIPTHVSPFRPSSPPRIPRISILPTNLGLMGKLGTAHTSLAQTNTSTPEPDFVEGQGFAIAVVHIPRDATRKLYERLVYVKMGERQFQIPDPTLHVLEPDQVTVDDKTLAAAFMLVGEFLLDPEKFQKSIEELEMEID